MKLLCGGQKALALLPFDPKLKTQLNIKININKKEEKVREMDKEEGRKERERGHGTQWTKKDLSFPLSLTLCKN